MYTLVFLLAIVSVVIARTITSPISETQSVVQIKAEIEERLRECKTKQLELETEVASLRQTVSMNLLEKQLQAIQNDVIFLIDKSRAEGKKMLALYDEISEIKTKMEATEHKINTMVAEKISLMDNQQKAIVMNISLLEIKQYLGLERVKNKLEAVANNVSSFGDRHDDVETKLQRTTETLLQLQKKMYDETNRKLELLQREQNITINNVELLTERYNNTDLRMSLMDNEQKTTKMDIASLERQHLSVTMQTDNMLGNLTEVRQQIKRVLNNITDSQKYVGIVATPFTVPNSNGIVIFGNVKYSFGVSGISSFKKTGKFTCEIPGLYIIIVSMMSCTYNDDTFKIYHNNDMLSYSYIGRGTSSHYGCDSATGHVIVALFPNDTIYVVLSYSSSSTVYIQWSSLSIIKAK